MLLDCEERGRFPSISPSALLGPLRMTETQREADRLLPTSWDAGLPETELAFAFSVTHASQFPFPAFRSARAVSLSALRDQPQLRRGGAWHKGLALGNAHLANNR